MNINTQIEFNKIQEIWAELASTDHAKEKISEANAILDEMDLRKELRDTTDSREMIEKLGNPPLQNVTEMKEIILVAEKDDCLTPYQLERVENVLVGTERLKDFLARGKQFNNPLAFYDENLDDIKELREEIVSQIRNEDVVDRASKILFDIRNKIRSAENNMKTKAEQIIRNNKDVMADSFYVLRSGRVCVPVKKEYKFKIPGSVIDKSSTGNTLFVEPVGVSKYFEEIELLRIEEENEVYRILYTLSAMVADVVPILEENVRMIEKLDYIFSKGKLSIDLDCVEPKINTERRMVLKKARHPLMDKEINVPLDVSLGVKCSGDGSGEEASYEEINENTEVIRGIVITGPNTGGKTVAIKTVMLNSLMAQCGLHVTCKEADICMNSNYLCDIGDGQNLSENLSTFSAHIKNVLEILKQVNKDSFVIMDELGSGTDPAEGMGIAVAVLEELRKSEANFLVTTHYPEVKEYADKTVGIVNARMTFDRETLKPTYKMVIGEAGESCAFYIADTLGMPEEMLKVAIEAAYGKGAVENYEFRNKEKVANKASSKIVKIKKTKKKPNNIISYNIGDSVMVSPDKKIGIVCASANEKGVLRVQIAGRKIWINQKRVKLLVKAEELYPEDYDFSIIFDSVEHRKLSHDMGRKYVEEALVYDSDNS
ncbi:MutS domain V [Eubacterium ruminantium]|uniref:MutS domain V n=1 Tax=Eubacterium ruminantium TaxID=42322 RepID=A0A1T4N8G3_9FIRM|nr:DNA mismatch repair protein MutS [Eubacterium ruminantium]SCW52279.1 MutS domain V [Eubacterium ruminantium]SDM63941.1 MutS domain V [Eubacterium ruminantium]SJZ75524.1 MutS domain V [Eubacterium ruminantium]